MTDAVTLGKRRAAHLAVIRNMAMGLTKAVYNLGFEVGHGSVKYVTMADIAYEVTAGLGEDISEELFGILAGAYDRGRGESEPVEHPMLRAEAARFIADNPGASTEEIEAACPDVRGLLALLGAAHRAGALRTESSRHDCRPVEQWWVT